MAGAPPAARVGSAPAGPTKGSISLDALERPHPLGRDDGVGFLPIIPASPARGEVWGSAPRCWSDASAASAASAA